MGTEAFSIVNPSFSTLGSGHGKKRLRIPRESRIAPDGAMKGISLGRPADAAVVGQYSVPRLGLVSQQLLGMYFAVPPALPQGTCRRFGGVATLESSGKSSPPTILQMPRRRNPYQTYSLYLYYIYIKSFYTKMSEAHIAGEPRGSARAQEDQWRTRIGCNLQDHIHLTC